MLKIIDKIVMSENAPENHYTLWLRPETDGTITMWAYKTGAWHKVNGLEEEVVETINTPV